MSLHQEWLDLIEHITDEAYEDFWKEYCEAEIKIYSDLLANSESIKSGTFDTLAQQYEVRPVMFSGFLDGINTSLQAPLTLETLDENSEISLPVDFEKLYYTMLTVQAEHLYGLSQWENVLSEEKRQELLKSYKRSKIIVKDQTPGRNDPCSCGSGKKYKKCCGA